jgi:hypothetical protein
MKYNSKDDTVSFRHPLHLEPLKRLEWLISPSSENFALTEVKRERFLESLLQEATLNHLSGRWNESYGRALEFLVEFGHYPDIIAKIDYQMTGNEKMRGQRWLTRPFTEIFELFILYVSHILILGRIYHRYLRFRSSQRSYS